MCGKASKKHLAVFLPVLVLLSCICFAEVTLTDSEAEEMLTEIQLAKKELESAKKDLETAETELSQVKSTWQEQKEYYEKRLNEAENKEEVLKTLNKASLILLLVVTVAAIL